MKMAAKIMCFSRLTNINAKCDKEIIAHFRNGGTVLGKC